MVFFLLLRPIDDVDLFTQIKLGELILEQRTLFLNDTFTYILAGVKIPPVGWLAQVIFALLYRFYSWPAVQFAHVLLFSSAFIIAGMSPILSPLKRRGDISLFSLAAAVLLGFLVSFNNSSVRPQTFAIISFSFLLYITQSNWRLRTKLLVLVPILLFWQNTHPSLLVGVLIMAVSVLTTWIAVFRNSHTDKPWGLSVMFLIVCAAQLATPLGWNVFEINAKNSLVSREWLGVSEWLPPWHESIRNIMIVFWVALALTAGFIAKLKGKVRLVDLSLFMVLTLLTLYAARFALFWALTMVPIWAMWIEQAKPINLFSWRGDGTIRKWILFITVLIGLTLVVSIVKVTRPSIIDHKSVPIRGIAHLKSILTHGRIYNYREYGGPLTFAGYPAWQVAMDGRLYLYDKTIWREYNNAALGKVPLQELVRRHKPDAFFLYPRFHKELIAELRRSQDWHEFYSDLQCITFLPSSFVNEKSWNPLEPGNGDNTQSSLFNQ